MGKKRIRTDENVNQRNTTNKRTSEKGRKKQTDKV